MNQKLVNNKKAINIIKTNHRILNHHIKKTNQEYHNKIKKEHKIDKVKFHKINKVEFHKNHK